MVMGHPPITYFSKMQIVSQKDKILVFLFHDQIFLLHHTLSFIDLAKFPLLSVGNIDFGIATAALKSSPLVIRW